MFDTAVMATEIKQFLATVQDITALMIFSFKSCSQANLTLVEIFLFFLIEEKKRLN